MSKIIAFLLSVLIFCFFVYFYMEGVVEKGKERQYFFAILIPTFSMTLLIGLSVAVDKLNQKKSK